MKKTTKKSATSAKTAKTAVKGQGKVKRAKLKLITLTPDLNKDALERGKEFMDLRAQGFKQSQIITMYAKAGVNVSGPSYFNAIKIAKAPPSVRKAIRSGAVPATLVISILKKRHSAKETEEKLGALIAEREKRTEFMEKSGFGGNGSAKLTTNRKIGLIRAKLEKIRGSEALANVRGQAVLAFIEAVENAHDAKALDAVIADFGGTAKKAAKKA